MDLFDQFNITQERAYPTPFAASPLLPVLLLSLVLQKNAPVNNVKKDVDELEDEYDYIVVGAGSAGSAVASRLSEEPCVSVLLIEAGKPPPKLTDIPGTARCFLLSDLDWQFYTTPQKHAAAAHIDRKVAFPSGKTLGGGSSLNAMLYVRGNRRHYDDWAEMGAKGWSYDECLPYFKKLEDNTEQEYLDNGYHASGGPITATRPAYNPEKKLALRQAILNEGYKFVDPNSKEQCGFFDYQSSTRRGQRNSAAKGYLAPNDNRTNFHILTDAIVRKVLIEDKKAKGVEFGFNGKIHQIKAKKEVILSAGSLKTSQLLMLSGIGLKSELSKHNISVIEELPVGNNLQDHQATVLPFLVNEDLPRFNDEVGKMHRINEYINNRTGPLTSSQGFIFMSFLSNEVNGTENIPDHTVYFEDFQDVLLEQVNLKPEVMEKFMLPYANKSMITCAISPLHPKSRGTVTLRSADPNDPPVIDPNYYEHPQDVNDMVQGLKTCIKIMNNPAMKKIGAKPIDAVFPGCEEFAEDQDNYLECMVRAFVITTAHPTGTARMGDPSDPNTVVDPELRVKGIQGLRVVDASIMPTIPWSNTNIPSIMVGEKGADIIKKTIKCDKK